MYYFINLMKQLPHLNKNVLQILVLYIKKKIILKQMLFFYIKLTIKSTSLPCQNNNFLFNLYKK